MHTSIAKYLLICCLTTLFCQMAGAVPAAKNLVKQGNDAYAGAQYNQAADLYEQALAQGVESAALYYNLGNAYYRLQKTAPAILNYERALRLQPHNKAAQSNLQLAKDRIANPIDELPEVFYRRWWAAVLGLLPSGLWAGGAVLFLWLAAGLGALFLLSAMAKQKKRTFTSAIACLVLAVLLHVVAYNRHQAETANNFAVVMQPAVALKKGPSDSSEGIAELPEGTKVRTNERVNGWVRIILTDNREGWVNEQNLTTI